MKTEGEDVNALMGGEHAKGGEGDAVSNYEKS